MLEYVPKIDEKNGSDKIINGEITFNNVTFQYPTASSPILKNLNLKIRKGEYIAFVGESGSGKSTIVKLI
jgi:ABC-type bacteriocin/lantibiotic exporter with double-glycine peptidase domain